MQSLDSIERSAKQIIQEAGTLLLHYFNSPMQFTFKGQFDMVTEADLASERYIIDALHQLTPNVPVLSEEQTDASTYQSSRDEWIWIVDPLDGTTNFSHGFPHFCISIALVHDGFPCLGLIYHPLSGELWHSQHGFGAYLNNINCQVSRSQKLETSILATGFPYRVRELKQNNLKEFCAFRLRSQGLRRTGAAALDLAYVACGRLDGFWEQWLKPWDTAAGWLMVQEASGVVSGFDGDVYRIGACGIVASNGLIHAEMLQIIHHPWPDLPQGYLDAL